MLRLHEFFRSSASFRVRIALNLKGLDYKPVSYRLKSGEHRAPAYLSLNPQGLVPALECDDGVISQSLAIIEYLDRIKPDPRLIPDDPAARARVLAIALTIACDIHPLNNLRVLRYLEDDLGIDDAGIKRWYGHWIAIEFTGLETRLAQSPECGRFCHGDSPGLADICLVPQVFNAQRFDCPLTEFPTIRRISDACMEIEAFRAAAPERQPDAF